MNTPHGMIEQDVRVLEQPGNQYERQRDPQQSRVVGDRQEQRKRDYDGGRAAASGAEEVGESFDTVDLSISVMARTAHGSGDSLIQT